MIQASNSNFAKGVAYAKAQNYSQALKSFTSAIEEHPNKFTSYLNRGSIECCLGLDEFAIEDFNKVVELEPYEITGYYNRFISYYKIGKKIEAQHDLYVALSLAYMKKGEELRQVGLIGKALDIVENNALAHIKRGNLYKEQGNIEMAINDYTGALEADDKNLIALTLRAPLYKHTDRQEEAEEDVQKIAELTTSHEKNNIVLVPKISKFTASQIESDIHSKVKEFTNLRNQIFRRGVEQAIANNEVKPIPDSQPRSNNKLETTLAQQTEEIADPEKVEDRVDNKGSLEGLADFEESSQNVNSSNQMFSENVVEKVRVDEIASDGVIEGKKRGEEAPIQYLEESQKLAEERRDKSGSSKKHESDNQEYNVQVLQTFQSQQVEQEPIEQTGDDTYGVEPPRYGQQENYLDAEEEEQSVKKSLVVSETVDNVKNSQDNQFLDVGVRKEENQNKDSHQNQEHVEQKIEYNEAERIENENDTQQNANAKLEAQQKIEEKITYEQPLILTQDPTSETIQIVQKNENMEKVGVEDQVQKQQQSKENQNQKDENQQQGQEQQQQEGEEEQGEQEQDQGEPMNKKESSKSKPWWEEEGEPLEEDQTQQKNGDFDISSNKAEPNLSEPNQQNQENEQRQSQPSEELSSIQNEQINQSQDSERIEDQLTSKSAKQAEPQDQNLLSLETSQTQNKNQEEEGEDKTDVASKPQTINFLKQDPIQNIQQIESFQLINSKVSGQAKSDRDNEPQNDDKEQLLRDIDEIKLDVKAQLKNVESMEYKLGSEFSQKSKREENQEEVANNKIREQIKEARLVESKVDVPEEEEDEIEEKEENFEIENANKPQATIQKEQKTEQQQKEQPIEQIQKLQIIIESATIERNTEWLGKMSPYVLILYNGWEQKTEVATQAGNAPQWNQTCSFIYKEEATEITFKIFDRQTFKSDDLIGQVTLNVLDIKGSQTLKLMFKEEPAAELVINIEIK